MNSDSIKKRMLENAEEINRLHTKVKGTFRLRDQSDEKKREWTEACREFHSRYNQLASPGGSEPVNGPWFEQIASGDPNMVEYALCFLECRPYFFHSGYMFKDILRKCKKAPMSAEQGERLRVILEKWEAYRKSGRRD